MSQQQAQAQAQSPAAKRLLEHVKKSRVNITVTDVNGQEFVMTPLTVKQFSRVVEAQQNDDTIAVLAVVEENIEPKNVPLYVLEQIIVQMYKQKNELKHDIRCTKCQKTSEHVLSDKLLQHTAISHPEIQLTGMKLKMNYPDAKSTLLLQNAGISDIINTVLNNVYAIDVGSETLVVVPTAVADNEISKEELAEVITHLDATGVSNIINFVKNIPTVVYTAPVKCNHCQHEGLYTQKGLAAIIY